MSIGYVQRSDAFPVEVNWRAVPMLPAPEEEEDPADS